MVCVCVRMRERECVKSSLVRVLDGGQENLPELWEVKSDSLPLHNTSTPSHPTPHSWEPAHFGLLVLLVVYIFFLFIILLAVCFLKLRIKSPQSNTHGLEKGQKNKNISNHLPTWSRLSGSGSFFQTVTPPHPHPPHHPSPSASSFQRQMKERCGTKGTF